MKSKIIPTDKIHLKKLILEEIQLNGVQCDLNHIDVSKIKDMSYMFYKLDFNGNISKWDMSEVRSMHNMFSSSNFAGDISCWNVGEEP